MDRYTIVIPTYNERENITLLVTDILALGLGSRVVIVDDNSPDGTGQLMSARLLLNELLANVLAMVFLPQSTYREFLAMLRLTTGLMAATILYGAAKRSKRVLNYTLLWLASLIFLTKEGPVP